MANVSVLGSRRGRLLALILGLLAIISLLTGVDRWATAKEPPKEETPAKPPAAVPSGQGAMIEQVRVINEQIEAQWKANNLTPSRRCSDYEFLRRATLDIIGRIATPQEIDQYMKDPIEKRRSMLIDRLLDSEEYARNWANVWSVWLLTRSGQAKYHDEMAVWLEEQFSKKDQGWDKTVTALLTASGSNDDNGAVNFVLSHMGEAIPPDKQAEEGHADFIPLTSRTTRLFLGLQTQCTQCHDHPFNPQWKQKNFWGVNAFFRQVKGERPPAMGRMELSPTLHLTDDPDVNKDGTVFYEERKGTVLMTRPEFLDGRRAANGAAKSRREILADFIITNPFFPKAFVNRLWGHFFGRGFTTQGAVDDFGDHNPLSHPLPEDFPNLDDLKKDYGDAPTLLDYLGSQFKQYNYDHKKLIQWICNSEPYQLSTVANKTNDKTDAEPFFSRMLLKSMTPEQLFESMMVATQAEAAETKEGKKELRQEWMKNLIVNFGDDEGNEVTFNGTVVQALMLMNGKEINDAVSNKEKGTVAGAMKYKTPGMVVEHLFMAALNRPPTAKELASVNTEIANIKLGRVKNKDVGTLYQDVFWALLNSNEFILDH